MKGIKKRVWYLILFSCLVLIIALLVSEFVAIITKNSQITTDSILASLTAILAFATIIYVMLTYNIVEGSEKVIKQSEIDRNIAHNEKKLEKLYFPLKETLEHLIFIYRNHGFEAEARVVPDDEWPEVKRNDEYILLIKTILSYQHLVEKNVKDDLDTFFKMINGQKAYTERGLLQFAVTLNEKVIEDISSLQINLDELHGIEKKATPITKEIKENKMNKKHKFKKITQNEKLTPFMVFFAILICVVIGITFLDSDLISKANVAFSGIIVIATVFYMFFTGMLFNETKKDRNVAFTEKRLEKFYYPLFSCLSSPSVIQEHHFQIENIFKYSYLATNDTKEVFSYYRHEKVFPEDSSKEKHEIYEDLFELVLYDINKFEEDLRHLVK